MEEKEEKNKIDKENLKNETSETAKKLKESLKTTKIKEETKATKGLVIEMFKNPLEKIKEVADNSSGKYFKTALFLIILWTIVVLIGSTYSTIYYWGFSKVFSNILNVLKRILAPALGILVYSIIVLILNKNNKKSLTNIISTITVTQLPLIASSVVSLLTIVSTKISIITSTFSNLCSIVAIILGYFGIKNLMAIEGNKEFIKKYVLIQAIYHIVYILIGLLGIYI